MATEQRTGITVMGYDANGIQYDVTFELDMYSTVNSTTYNVTQHISTVMWSILSDSGAGNNSIFNSNVFSSPNVAGFDPQPNLPTNTHSNILVFYSDDVVALNAITMSTSMNNTYSNITGNICLVGGGGSGGWVNTPEVWTSGGNSTYKNTLSSSSGGGGAGGQVAFGQIQADLTKNIYTLAIQNGQGGIPSTQYDMTPGNGQNTNMFLYTAPAILTNVDIPQQLAPATINLNYNGPYAQALGGGGGNSGWAGFTSPNQVKKWPLGGVCGNVTRFDQTPSINQDAGTVLGVTQTYMDQNPTHPPDNPYFYPGVDGLFLYDTSGSVDASSYYIYTAIFSGNNGGNGSMNTQIKSSYDGARYGNQDGTNNYAGGQGQIDTNLGFNASVLHNMNNYPYILGGYYNLHCFSSNYPLSVNESYTVSTNNEPIISNPYTINGTTYGPYDYGTLGSPKLSTTKVDISTWEPNTYIVAYDWVYTGFHFSGGGNGGNTELNGSGFPTYCGTNLMTNTSTMSTTSQTIETFGNTLNTYSVPWGAPSNSVYDTPSLTSSLQTSFIPHGGLSGFSYNILYTTPTNSSGFNALNTDNVDYQEETSGLALITESPIGELFEPLNFAVEFSDFFYSLTDTQNTGEDRQAITFNGGAGMTLGQGGGGAGCGTANPYGQNGGYFPHEPSTAGACSVDGHGISGGVGANGGFMLWFQLPGQFMGINTVLSPSPNQFTINISSVYN